MKLAITKADNFPFGVHVTRIEGGVHVVWSNGSARIERTITEAFIRAHCGEREISDFSNVYLETDVSKPDNLYVHNKMALTTLTKNDGWRHLLKSQRVCLGQIYIPFADSGIDEWIFRLNQSTLKDVESKLPSNVIDVALDHQAFLDIGASVWPGLKVASVEKLDDERSAVTVQLTLAGQTCTRAGVRVFASSATGYLSKREVRTDAKGQVRVIARRLDLEPEDGPMAVEFGFKFVRNLANAEV